MVCDPCTSYLHRRAGALCPIADMIMSQAAVHVLALSAGLIGCGTTLTLSRDGSTLSRHALLSRRREHCQRCCLVLRHLETLSFRPTLASTSHTLISSGTYRMPVGAQPNSLSLMVLHWQSDCVISPQHALLSYISPLHMSAEDGRHHTGSHYFTWF